MPMAICLCVFVEQGLKKKKLSISDEWVRVD